MLQTSCNLEDACTNHIAVITQASHTHTHENTSLRAMGNNLGTFWYVSFDWLRLDLLGVAWCWCCACFCLPVSDFVEFAWLQFALLRVEYLVCLWLHLTSLSLVRWTLFGCIWLRLASLNFAGRCVVVLDFFLPSIRLASPGSAWLRLIQQGLAWFCLASLGFV